jgi:hypothetical protein
MAGWGGGFGFVSARSVQGTSTITKASETILLTFFM